MIITSTPLRISFFGGGTDYPVWYREHGGAVLATTIDKSCYITCRYLPPFFEYHSRISYSKVENVEQNWSIQHPSVRACLQFMQIEEGVEIVHVADLPARTGLGTSSAFTVGLLLGLYGLQQRMRDKHSLAADAIHVEQDLISEAVGSQDQVSAAYGGFNRIDFRTDGAIDVRRVLAPAQRLNELQDHLALFFTGFSRTASEVATEQIRLTPERQRELQLMKEMVGEAESIVAGSNRPIGDFGKLLHEAWQVKRTLTDKISNPLIDEIYEAGRSAGALGGKLLGAGGGGFMLFFVPPERREELRVRLNKLLCVPIAFSSKGSQVVVYEPEKQFDQVLRKERDSVYGGQSPKGAPVWWRESPAQAAARPNGSSLDERGSK
ncbi:MAG: kinase [Bryobacteraceae bacterium]|nr:kinase [Bryobacteraceae bacterium]